MSTALGSDVERRAPLPTHPPRLSMELQGSLEYLRLLSILIGLFVQMLWGASPVLSNQCMKYPSQHCLSIKVQCLTQNSLPVHQSAHFFEEIIPMVHSVPGFEHRIRDQESWLPYITFLLCLQRPARHREQLIWPVNWVLSHSVSFQIDCAELCWDDYRKHESSYGHLWFSGPLFNLAQRACDQSIASADHGCSLGQKNVALQTTLMNNRSQSRCCRGKCGHQWGVWRSWRWTWVEVGSPCPSVLSPWKHTGTHKLGLYTCAHTVTPIEYQCVLTRGSELTVVTHGLPGLLGPLCLVPSTTYTQDLSLPQRIWQTPCVPCRGGPRALSSRKPLLPHTAYVQVQDSWPMPLCLQHLQPLSTLRVLHQGPVCPSFRFPEWQTLSGHCTWMTCTEKCQEQASGPEIPDVWMSERVPLGRSLTCALRTHCFVE